MADTMKAAYIKQVGPPENIIFGEIPKPSIKSDQVLVKVKAVAVDHVDTYIRSGQYTSEASFPLVLGSDMVGVVENVGKDVKSFKVGQKVWSNNLGIHGRQGSFSEYVAIDENILFPLPQNVNEKEVVASIQAASTALIGLIRVAKLKSYETILVSGGAGNVGSAIIQLAAARGANVIATSGSKEKLDWCKKIGASHAFNYKTDNLEQAITKVAPDGINVFWDTSKQPNLELAVNLLAPKGRIILMAGYNAHPTFPVGPFYTKECSMHGFYLPNTSPEELKGYAEIINRVLEEKKFLPRIAKEMPLAETINAHKLLESDSDLWGKIVLTVS